jgi:transposase-like protein
MNTKQTTQGRRVLTQYSAEDRERIIDEQKKSGLSKVTFCKERGINLTTFYGWAKKHRASCGVKETQNSFKEVKLPVTGVAPVEIIFPDGTRINIRHTQSKELVSMVRGVLNA